jgi:hypothetical protein
VGHPDPDRQLNLNARNRPFREARIILDLAADHDGTRITLHERPPPAQADGSTPPPAKPSSPDATPKPSPGSPHSMNIARTRRLTAPTANLQCVRLPAASSNNPKEP